MDQHSLMWTEATRDLDAENAQRALAYALADLSGVRDFTHAAVGPTEYTQRVALTASTVARHAAAHGADPQDVQRALDASYSHVLSTRRTARIEHARRQASATPPPPQPAAEPPAAPATPPGTPADLLTDTTAKTSKPRTLPSGGTASIPAGPVPTGPSAPTAPTPTGPGAQGMPKAASRHDAIAAEIAAYNPHLPAATIDRLTRSAMRHLAAEPLAYSAWEDTDDGPITDTLKKWKPGAKPGGSGDGQAAAGEEGGSTGLAAAAEELPVIA